MEKTYKKTNLYTIDEKLWEWAKFRANTLGHDSVSEYVFALIELDKICPTALDLENSLKKMIREIEGIHEPRLDEIDMKVYENTYNEIALKGLQELMDKIRKVSDKEVNEK